MIQTIKVALKNGMTPTSFLLRKKKHQKRWEPIDYGLAEAIDILDSEKCRKCGTPTWQGCSENADIQFEIDEHHCYACEYLEQYEDKKSDKDPKKFGVTEFVKAIHSDAELHDIKPEDIPELDWKYRYEFYHGHKPDES